MRFRRPLLEEPELNLIPLIDILLVVLIFLAVSTTYSRFAQLEIELPSANTEAPDARADEVRVAVTADGRYSLGGPVLAATAATELATHLKAAAAGQPRAIVVIDADAQAPHQAVIRVLEAARIAGLAQISFTTESAEPAAVAAPARSR